MSSQEWFAGSDPDLKLHNDQIAAIFSRRCWLRLAIWGGSVIFASIMLAFLLPDGICSMGSPVLVALLSLPIVGGFCSSAHFFSRFALSKERRYLLLAIAFIVLGISIAIKSSLDLFSADSSLIKEWSAAAGWVIFATCLFRYRKAANINTDRTESVLIAFLMPAMASVVMILVSDLKFDHWWLGSAILMSAAWLSVLGSIVVDGALARKEVVEQVEEMEILRQISWDLVGIGELSELLDKLVFALIGQLDIKIAAVYMPDETSLRLAAASGPEGFSFPVGTKYEIFSENRRPGFHTGHTSDAFKSKDVRIAYDLSVDGEFVPWREIAADNGCAVSMPLISQDRAIGVLNLYLAQGSQLTPQRLKLMITIAAAATLAIEKALPNSNNIICNDDEFMLAA